MYYYMGFDPDGNYRFANAHHVARYYRVSSDAVLRWLEELDLSPHQVLFQRYNLAAASVDLQLEAEDLTLEELRAKGAEILAELDEARGGRRLWEGEFGDV
jgi:hypothetical protein